MSIGGKLYVVATPIGNLGDMSPRAVETLRRADRIAAEDTRHSGRLLRQFDISRPMVSLHEHNEQRTTERLIGLLRAGENIALISDAGTPLVSDPGYRLVRAAHAEGLQVVPVPGPAALIAALSASGLPTDRFAFEGFLPSRAGPRRKLLESLRGEEHTLIFYEAPHRIVEAVRDMAEIFGAAREAAFGRELTKSFETVRSATLGDLADWIAADADQQRGEMVVLVRGAVADRMQDGPDAESRRVAALLAEELPLRQAAALTARITGARKNQIYEFLVKKEHPAQ